MNCDPGSISGPGSASGPGSTGVSHLGAPGSPSLMGQITGSLADSMPGVSSSVACSCPCSIASLNVAPVVDTITVPPVRFTARTRRRNPWRAGGAGSLTSTSPGASLSSTTVLREKRSVPSLSKAVSAARVSASATFVVSGTITCGSGCPPSPPTFALSPPQASSDTAINQTTARRAMRVEHERHCSEFRERIWRRSVVR